MKEFELSKRRKKRIERMCRKEKHVEKIENRKLNTSCVYGLNTLHKRYERTKALPIKRITLNRTQEEWNKILQQAKV